jgi:fumarate reductase subunit C
MSAVGTIWDTYVSMATLALVVVIGVCLLTGAVVQTWIWFTLAPTRRMQDAQIRALVVKAQERHAAERAAREATDGE